MLGAAGFLIFKMILTASPDSPPLATVLNAVQNCRLVDLGMKGRSRMESETDPLAQFGLDAIDLRWTLKDIATKRGWMINKQHLAQLIELGLVEMREDVPHLTIAGQNTTWKA
jgi:hypothetical protein